MNALLLHETARAAIAEQAGRAKGGPFDKDASVMASVAGLMAAADRFVIPGVNFRRVGALMHDADFVVPLPPRPLTVAFVPKAQPVPSQNVLPLGEVVVVAPVAAGEVPAVFRNNLPAAVVSAMTGWVRLVTVYLVKFPGVDATVWTLAPYCVYLPCGVRPPLVREGRDISVGFLVGTLCEQLAAAAIAEHGAAARASMENDVSNIIQPWLWFELVRACGNVTVRSLSRGDPATPVSRVGAAPVGEGRAEVGADGALEWRLDS